MTAEFVLHNYPRDYKIVCTGGGHGPTLIEDALLQITQNVISAATTVDSSGQSFLNSQIIIPQTGEYLPPLGDFLGRMRSHTRDLELRKMFDRTSKNNPLYPDKRIMNDFLAITMIEQGLTLHEAIKWWEGGILRDVYRGRVIPESDRKLDLRLTFEDGSSVVGEHHIDNMKPGDSPIVNEELVHKVGDSYEPWDIPTNQEYPFSLKTAHGICIMPGTVHANAPLLIPQEIKDIINNSQIPVLMIPNALNTPETEGWSPKQHVLFFKKYLGIRITHVLFNQISEPLPPLYQEKINQRPVYTKVVSADESKAQQEMDEVRQHAEHVEVRSDLTTFEDFVDPQTHIPRKIVVHNGELVAERIVEILDSFWDYPGNGFHNNGKKPEEANKILLTNP